MRGNGIDSSSSTTSRSVDSVAHPQRYIPSSLVMPSPLALPANSNSEDQNHWDRARFRRRSLPTSVLNSVPGSSNATDQTTNANSARLDGPPSALSSASALLNTNPSSASFPALPSSTRARAPADPVAPPSSVSLPSGGLHRTDPPPSHTAPHPPSPPRAGPSALTKLSSLRAAVSNSPSFSPSISYGPASRLRLVPRSTLNEMTTGGSTLGGTTTTTNGTPSSSSRTGVEPRTILRSRPESYVHTPTLDRSAYGGGYSRPSSYSYGYSRTTSSSYTAIGTERTVDSGAATMGNGSSIDAHTPTLDPNGQGYVHSGAAASSYSFGYPGMPSSSYAMHGGANVNAAPEGVEKRHRRSQSDAYTHLSTSPPLVSVPFEAATPRSLRLPSNSVSPRTPRAIVPPRGVGLAKIRALRAIRNAQAALVASGLGEELLDQLREGERKIIETIGEGARTEALLTRERREHDSPPVYMHPSLSRGSTGSAYSQESALGLEIRGEGGRTGETGGGEPDHETVTQENTHTSTSGANGTHILTSSENVAHIGAVGRDVEERERGKDMSMGDRDLGEDNQNQAEKHLNASGHVTITDHEERPVGHANGKVDVYVNVDREGESSLPLNADKDGVGGMEHSAEGNGDHDYADDDGWPPKEWRLYISAMAPKDEYVPPAQIQPPLPTSETSSLSSPETPDGSWVFVPQNPEEEQRDQGKEIGKREDIERVLQMEEYVFDEENSSFVLSRKSSKTGTKPDSILLLSPTSKTKQLDTLSKKVAAKTEKVDDATTQDEKDQKRKRRTSEGSNSTNLTAATNATTGKGRRRRKLSKSRPISKANVEDPVQDPVPIAATPTTSTPAPPAAAMVSKIESPSRPTSGESTPPQSTRLASQASTPSPPIRPSPHPTSHPNSRDSTPPPRERPVPESRPRYLRHKASRSTSHIPNYPSVPSPLAVATPLVRSKSTGSRSLSLGLGLRMSKWGLERSRSRGESKGAEKENRKEDKGEEEEGRGRERERRLSFNFKQTLRSLPFMRRSKSVSDAHAKSTHAPARLAKSRGRPPPVPVVPVQGVAITKENFLGYARYGEGYHNERVRSRVGSYAGSARGSAGSYKASVRGSAGSVKGSVKGSAESHRGSGKGSAESHKGSGKGSAEPHKGSGKGISKTGQDSLESGGSRVGDMKDQTPKKTGGFEVLSRPRITPLQPSAVQSRTESSKGVVDAEKGREENQRQPSLSNGQEEDQEQYIMPVIPLSDPPTPDLAAPYPRARTSVDGYRMSIEAYANARGSVDGHSVYSAYSPGSRYSGSRYSLDILRSAGEREREGVRGSQEILRAYLGGGYGRSDEREGSGNESSLLFAGYSSGGGSGERTLESGEERSTEDAGANLSVTTQEGAVEDARSNESVANESAQESSRATSDTNHDPNRSEETVGSDETTPRNSSFYTPRNSLTPSVFFPAANQRDSVLSSWTVRSPVLPPSSTAIAAIAATPVSSRKNQTQGHARGGSLPTDVGTGSRYIEDEGVPRRSASPVPWKTRAWVQGSAPSRTRSPSMRSSSALSATSTSVVGGTQRLRRDSTRITSRSGRMGEATSSSSELESFHSPMPAPASLLSSSPSPTPQGSREREQPLSGDSSTISHGAEQSVDETHSGKDRGAKLPSVTLSPMGSTNASIEMLSSFGDGAASGTSGTRGDNAVFEAYRAVNNGANGDSVLEGASAVARDVGNVGEDKDLDKENGKGDDEMLGHAREDDMDVQVGDGADDGVEEELKEGTSGMSNVEDDEVDGKDADFVFVDHAASTPTNKEKDNKKEKDKGKGKEKEKKQMKKKEKQKEKEKERGRGEDEKEKEKEQVTPRRPSKLKKKHKIPLIFEVLTLGHGHNHSSK